MTKIQSRNKILNFLYGNIFKDEAVWDWFGFFLFIFATPFYWIAWGLDLISAPQEQQEESK